MIAPDNFDTPRRTYCDRNLNPVPFWIYIVDLDNEWCSGNGNIGVH
jgi:hypothetical protein